MISLKQFNIKKVQSASNSDTFQIGPLPQGYGSTLGTFLRRTLLSSIPGSAVTAVKIEGVDHEYSSMDGLSDDVLTVALSLKNVVVISKSLDPITVEINVTGKNGQVVEVTAGDIEKNQNIEVVNPEYVITRLTSAKAKFKATLTIERGVGYALPNEDMRKELGVLPLDANFSPVKLVNYAITPARVGRETELDQLDLTIETNGAVTSVEALHVASDILAQMTNHLITQTEQMLSGKEVTIAVNAMQKEQEEQAKVVVKEAPIKVADLNLSTRLTNALLKSNYENLRTLEGLTEEEVASIRGMGSKSYLELLEVLKKYSIKLV
ncbi:MAG: DNA-directed RNA polymerase subunit alpha [Candidatus Dojkabacteria bacterium]